MTTLNEVAAYSCEELCAFLAKHGLGECTVTKFKEENVDGSTFVILTPVDVSLEFNDLPLSERVRIRRVLNKLNEGSTSTSSSTSTSTPSTSASTPSASSFTSASDDHESTSIARVASCPAQPPSTPTLTCTDRSIDDDTRQHATITDELANYKPTDLPDNFKIPTKFGREIDRQLQQNREVGSIDEKYSKHIRRQIAHHVYSFQANPSRKTLEWLAYSLYRAHPGVGRMDPQVILSKISPNLGEQRRPFKPWGNLTQQLIRLMENIRASSKRRFSQDENKVKTNKKAKIADEVEPGILENIHLESHSAQIVHTILINSFISRITEDDELALNRHYEMLKKECRSKHPKKEVILELLRKELSRRKDRLESFSAKSRIKEISKEYPCLKWPDVLMEELTIHLEHDYKKKFTPQELILNWVKNLPHLRMYLNNYLEENDDSHDKDQELPEEVVLMSLPTLFSTKSPRARKAMGSKGAKDLTKHFVYILGENDSLTDIPKDMTSPFLLCRIKEAGGVETIMVMENSKNTYLTLEATEASGSESIVGKSVICLMAMYFVYMLHYPDAVKNSFYFLQQYVLGIEDLPARSTVQYQNEVQKYLKFLHNQQ
ncbi:hypothetical protein AC249_AIPGENE21112 [Exaiptasia diaphana]|nr:hypothetical protein AC249_AIPGENE21112 [Exaiptasia diaphana]